MTIEITGNRLFVTKKPAAGEAKLASFKARLAERLREAKYADRQWLLFVAVKAASIEDNGADSWHQSSPFRPWIATLLPSLILAINLAKQSRSNRFASSWDLNR